MLDDQWPPGSVIREHNLATLKNGAIARPKIANGESMDISDALIVGIIHFVQFNQYRGFTRDT